MSNVDHEGTDLVTTAEAARMLGVSVATVNRWAARGELTPIVKHSGLRGPRLYRRTDVQTRTGSEQVPA